MFCNAIDLNLASLFQSLSRQRDGSTNIFVAIVPMSSPHLPPHQFKLILRLAPRYHRFTVELYRCNRMLDSNCLFSRIPFQWNSLVICCFPDTYNLYLNLNATPIAIFCLHEYCSFIALYRFSHSLPLVVITCVLVSLSPCLE